MRVRSMTTATELVMYDEESDSSQTITTKKPDHIDESTPKNTGIHQR